MLSPDRIRSRIASAIPDGTVVPEHTEQGHFYRVDGHLLPSVTGKLQVLKDGALTNWKMNRALDYVYEHWKSFTDESVLSHLETARNASGVILEDAGDIGSLIHDCRERYYREWIDTGVRPRSAVDFVPRDHYDIRAVSAMRAIERFVIDWNYIPVATELLVYDVDLTVAGTLDDIGMMRSKDGKNRELVLCDLKSSNAFKNSYHVQIALYYMMFTKLTKLKPTRCFILKVSKEDGTYQLEDLGAMAPLVKIARHVLEVNKGIDYIASIRKDNQKTVIKI